jgi:hypothetical protein|tara:strand:- start:619 stop:972 length:354 start_codon:yes stop_codon:yes gene_type:complete
MNIRTFQIVVPLLAVIFIFWQFWKIYNFKIKLKAIWPGILVAFFISIIALFPDVTTNWLAKTLDFKSNVNAIIFILIGTLFGTVIILYDLYKRQQKTITKLTIELSLIVADKDDVDS